MGNSPQLALLAEKMMDKVVSENKIKTSEILLFCILLPYNFLFILFLNNIFSEKDIQMLTHSGKFDKIIELLEGPLGVSLLNDAIPGERIHIFYLSLFSSFFFFFHPWLIYL